MINRLELHNKKMRGGFFLFSFYFRSFSDLVFLSFAVVIELRLEEERKRVGGASAIIGGSSCFSHLSQVSLLLLLLLLLLSRLPSAWAKTTKTKTSETFCSCCLRRLSGAAGTLLATEKTCILSSTACVLHSPTIYQFRAAEEVRQVQEVKVLAGGSSSSSSS